MVYLRDGIKEFINYSFMITGGSDNCPHSGLVRGVTVSFSDFIEIIYKYTYKRNVELNAKIVHPRGGKPDYLVVWGVRDPELRQDRPPKYLPNRQKGIWSCILEDALNFGFSGEEISQFRHSLNLLPEYSIDDDEFFQKEINMPY